MLRILVTTVQLPPLGLYMAIMRVSVILVQIIMRVLWMDIQRFGNSNLGQLP